MKRLLHYFCFLVPMLAQGQVANYQFASLNDVYTPIVGGAVLGTTQNDDRPYNDLQIGFNFNYDGNTYTTFAVNPNGFIVLGGPAIATGPGAAIDPNSNSGIALSSTAENNDLIAAFNMDLQGQPTASLTYLTEGVSPNQILTVQWTNYRIYSRQASVGDTFNFQIKLSEGSNQIQVVYGRMAYNHTDSSQAQVGLRGGSNADFNLRTTTNSWVMSDRGTANTQGMAVLPVLLPPEGLTYIWYRPLVVDLSVRQALRPAENGCLLGAAQPVRALVSNEGFGSIDTLIGAYSVNGTLFSQEVIVLNPPLAQGDRRIVAFAAPYDFSVQGDYSVNLSLRALHEDSTTSADDTASTLYTSAPPRSQFPYLEEFTDSTVLPTGWAIEHLDGFGDWALHGSRIQTNVGRNGFVVYGNQGTLFFNSYLTAFRGSHSRIASPCLDLSGITTDSLLLDIRYLQSDIYPQGPDSIQVMVSTNAGGAYTQIATLFRYNGDSLQIPRNTAAWSLSHLNLTAYRGEPSFRVALIAGGADGYSMAVDYVHIRPANVVIANRPTVATAVTTHPNPTTGKVLLANLPAASIGTQAVLLNAAGTIVRSFSLTNEINLDGLPSGLYNLQAAGVKARIAKQ